MANNNGDPAKNFAFKKLNGSDTAGHNSINDMLSSFDDKLGTAMSGMIVLYQGTAAPTTPVNAAGDAMWSNVTSTITTAGGPSPGTGYIWIKKVN